MLLPPKYTLLIKSGEKKKIMTWTIKSAFEINKPKIPSIDLISKIFPIHSYGPQIFKIIYLFTERINKRFCLMSLSLPFSASQVYFSFVFFGKPEKKNTDEVKNKSMHVKSRKHKSLHMNLVNNKLIRKLYKEQTKFKQEIIHCCTR